MRTLEALIADIQQEAERAEFPIDTPVYERSGKTPTEPILFAGTLSAPVCVFARDLGKDEVAAGQPLIGAGGRLVREGLIRRFGGEAPRKADKGLESALAFALLTNTVPFKPPGNKAYTEKVKDRFRPFLAEFLADFWAGEKVLTLGTEAFQWFNRYGASGALDAFWKDEDRYEKEISVTIPGRGGKGKTLTLMPLPHPSPLNQRWYGKFPELLDARLKTIPVG